MNSRKLLVFAMLIFLLTACGVKTTDAIKGVWQSDARHGTVEFGDNGYYNATIPNGDSFTGSYKFIDSNTVEISVPEEWGGTYSVGVKVSGDTLTFISTADGTSSDLTRVK